MARSATKGSGPSVVVDLFGGVLAGAMGGVVTTKFLVQVLDRAVFAEMQQLTLCYTAPQP